MNHPSTGQAIRKDREGHGEARGRIMPPPSSHEDRGSQSLQMLASLWRRKWTMAVIVAIALAIGWAYTKTITPIYHAQAIVAIESSKSNVIDIDAVASGIGGSNFFDIHTQVQVLTSRKLLEKVVDKLDLMKVPEFNPSLRAPPAWREWSGYNDLRAALGMERPEPVVFTPEQARRIAVDMLVGRVTAGSIPRTLAFSITVQSEDPGRAADIANAVAQQYIVDQLEAKFEATRVATEWLSQRVAELQIDLEAAEKQVEDFMTSTSLVSEEALALQNRQLKDARERLADLGVELTGENALIADTRAALESKDYARAGELLGAGDVVRLAESLETYDETERPQRAERIEALIDSQLARHEQQALRLTRQIEALRKSVADQEALIAEQSRALVELRQYQREAEASRTLYEFFLARMKETAVQEGIQEADARILSDAVRPWGPSAPRSSMLMTIALMIGLMVAVAYILIAERLNNTIRTARDLEAFTGLGVMGTIPEAPFRRRRALIDYLANKPTSNMAESLRNLRTSILLSNIDHPPQVVTISSSVPGEGKTTCSIGLAVTSAMMGKRVLLIECDFRRRVFSTYFNTGDRPGLISILSGEVSTPDAIYQHEATGIDVIVGEKSPVSATDIFTSERFGQFIEAMREHYDFIFLDTPPVLAVPDARMVAKQTDALVFAVRWNSTTRAMVEDALALFGQIDLPVSGCVLTQVNQRQMARYGYGGYGGYRGVSKYYTS